MRFQSKDRFSLLQKKSCNVPFFILDFGLVMGVSVLPSLLLLLQVSSSHNGVSQNLLSFVEG